MNYIAIPGFKTPTIKHQVQSVVKGIDDPNYILLKVANYYLDKKVVVVALRDLKYPISKIGLISAMKGKSRKREIVMVRQCFYYVYKQINPKITLKTLGKILGHRDHSTVIHGIRTWQDLMDTDGECWRNTQNIFNILKH